MGMSAVSVLLAVAVLAPTAGCASIAGVEDLSIYDAGSPMEAGDSSDATEDASADAPPHMITWRDTTTTFILADQPEQRMQLSRPPMAAPGDVLIAGIAMGDSEAPTTPVYTPPTGWSLVRRLDEGAAASLAIYWHAVTGSEPSMYTWTFETKLEGVAWLSDYAGVDTATPYERENGSVIDAMGTSYATPTITTTAPNSLVLASFAGHCCEDKSDIPMWIGPSGMEVRANLNDDSTGSGLAAELPLAAQGSAGPYTARINVTQDYALTHVMALLPAP
jgi:hypothetical protein